MATSPLTFDWKSLIQPLELASNIALTLFVPGGATYAPLVAALENAINPLLQSIGTKPDVTNEVMAVYGTVIAALQIAKQAKGLDQATLDKINEYLGATMDAMAAYIKAGKGYDPSLYGPVNPIP